VREDHEIGARVDRELACDRERLGAGHVEHHDHERGSGAPRAADGTRERVGDRREAQALGAIGRDTLEHVRIEEREERGLLGADVHAERRVARVEDVLAEGASRLVAREVRRDVRDAARGHEPQHLEHARPRCPEIVLAGGERVVAEVGRQRDEGVGQITRREARDAMRLEQAARVDHERIRACAPPRERSGEPCLRVWLDEPTLTADGFPEATGHARGREHTRRGANVARLLLRASPGRERDQGEGQDQRRPEGADRRHGARCILDSWRRASDSRDMPGRSRF